MTDGGDDACDHIVNVITTSPPRHPYHQYNLISIIMAKLQLIIHHHQSLVAVISVAT
jgi:hypothetical protein